MELRQDSFLITKDSPLNIREGIETMAYKDPDRYRSLLESQNELRNLRQYKETPQVLKRIDDLELNIKTDRTNWSNTSKENLRIANEVDDIPGQLDRLRRSALDNERLAMDAVRASDRLATPLMLRGLTKTTLYFGDQDLAGALEAVTGRRPININSRDGADGIYARGKDGSVSRVDSDITTRTTDNRRVVNPDTMNPIRGRGEVVVRDGRVVNDIELGYNQNILHWDGRDKFGNYLSTGVYLITSYKNGNVIKGKIAIIRK